MPRILNFDTPFFVSINVSINLGLIAAVMLVAGCAALVTTSANAQSAVLLQPVATGINGGVAVAHAGDGSGRLFIVQKGGLIRVFDGTSIGPTPFLDLQNQVSGASEQGLLSMAFDPNYSASGFFYVFYTDLSGAAIVARYTVSSDPNVADPASQLVILSIPQPFSNHNGGQLQFGRDGFLYIASGDGGSGGDPGNRAQSLDTLLGKILRIDVSDALPYEVPASNPFVGVAGALPEIWSYGLRNPWRFSFDRVTGDMFIGDVGQGGFEEVNFQPASSAGGENYGWRLMEGNSCFNPPTGCESLPLVRPIIDYPHAGPGTCTGSITGGYRYRGKAFPQLAGLYFYADFCSADLFAATDASGTWVSTPVSQTGLDISSFGEDENGEIYLLHFNPAGALFRIEPNFPVCEISVNQSVFLDGQTVTAEEFIIANPGPIAVSTELKFWLDIPGLPPTSLLNLGSDGSLVLTPGFVQNYGPLPLLTVDAGLPRGDYDLACRLLDPTRGQQQQLDSNPFQVQ